VIQEFLIKGIARPVSRPRVFTNRGGITRAIRNPKDVAWEKSIISQVLANKPHFFSRDIPIKVICFAFYKKPKDATYDYAISHSLGDNDNWLKGILDALQSKMIKVGKLRVKQKGLCFEDDAQVVRLIGEKAYTTKEDYVILRITDELYNKEVEWLL
jgi:Holliday junction resolvase RusA-like endonuclease